MVGPFSDAELDRGVEVKTFEEVSKGWLGGPFTAAEMDARHEFWLPARRFGVRHGSKLRCIDDYSVFGHSSAVFIPDKADMRGIDMVVGVCRAYARCWSTGR